MANCDWWIKNKIYVKDIFYQLQSIIKKKIYIFFVTILDVDNCNWWIKKQNLCENYILSVTICHNEKL